MRARVSFLGVAVAAFVVAGSQAAAASWAVDSAHTGVHFSVRHMMVSNVRGQFKQVSGRVVYDPAKPTQSKVEVTIQAASIDTGNAKRDEHLRGPDFFDVGKYSTIKLVSKSISRSGDKGKIVADLTLHGVTREVTFDVVGPTEPIKNPWGQTVIGAQATTVLRRKDFGLTWNKTLDTGGVVVGDEVTVTVDIELQRE